jgi:hypothetical protein
MTHVLIVTIFPTGNNVRCRPVLSEIASQMRRTFFADGFAPRKGRPVFAE